MGDTNLSDYSIMDLPAEIRERLAELDLELSEGRCRNLYSVVIKNQFWIFSCNYTKNRDFLQ